MTSAHSGSHSRSSRGCGARGFGGTKSRRGCGDNQLAWLALTDRSQALNIPASKSDGALAPVQESAVHNRHTSSGSGICDAD